MAPKRRQHKKVGNMRMDAALDAMRQLGFEEKLVRGTIKELLDVYEGTQGWPFIEEGSYKLLIETILCKQQTCVQKMEGYLQGGVGETSSAATSTTGITEVGSSVLVAQDSVLHGTHDLDSASQTNDHHDYVPIANLEVETNIKVTNVSTERCEDGRDIGMESKNEQKPMDNVKESNYKTFVSNVETNVMKSSMIESSKRSEKLPSNRRRRYHGWISSDDNNVDFLYFPRPPLPEHIEKLIGKSEATQIPRRKSRWDEKPDVCEC
ncbi:uncharacterized protein [Cicer arietinum]|uniref:Uncharacterized protein LOC101498341 isoform X2 n=1 Tax=Cicer arietinum TaxID=3827 RepID=A0A3Q7XUW7_CICAR|nr:uncharacterized protein LOC101498341 isoform X2 [Cicer arietinum]